MESQDEIFLTARDLADPAERAAYLTQACGNDADLRQRVEAMLRDAAGADEFFGPEGKAVLGAAVTEGPGTVIGRYKLLQQIGEGGMGVVYMAEQRQPVIRKVALKIIKLGMDTRQVVARFEAERQALALMDHPNIAKVLDGGVTESGRPYFVMDLVPGLPITQFCDESSLPTRDRLELFLEVCSAIQHAHQKGIIHRDIKPSNILVTLHGDQPVPKVIDFGVAKATQGRLTDKTLFTQFQQFIGTPAYMSPEQASLSGLDIDARSDIYALDNSCNPSSVAGVSQVTLILNAIQHGDSKAADKLLPLIYEELRRLATHKMAREAPGQTLQPTALVHEAWLRLVGDGDPGWQNRAHFFAAAAEAMRRILVDRARRKHALRHGGSQVRVEMDETALQAPADDEKVLQVHDALEMLAVEDPQKAEIVKLRFFGGLSHEEIAQVLSVNEKTVRRHWEVAKVRLFQVIKAAQ